MSKMIRVESCETCDIRLRGFCGIFSFERLKDKKIIPNCPLEDYKDGESFKIGQYTITTTPDGYFIRSEGGEGFGFSENLIKEFFNANM